MVYLLDMKTGHLETTGGDQFPTSLFAWLDPGHLKPGMSHLWYEWTIMVGKISVIRGDPHFMTQADIQKKH